MSTMDTVCHICDLWTRSTLFVVVRFVAFGILPPK
jgi:hypothetical protein